MVLGTAAGCSNNSKSTAASGGKDTITALLPPVSADYQNELPKWIDEYQKKNPNITVKLTTASWEDFTQKLDVQVNAGTPPDVAFIGSDGVSKYVNSGMAVDISKYLDSAKLKDYEPKVINYFKNGNGQYGLPAYVDIQCLGGNKAMLEKAGIDWKSIQKNGWTYDQFREAIKKGVVKDGDNTKTYGFLFACSGVTSKDYFSIFAKNAGFPADFTKDLKYAYTGKNMLSYLKDLRTLIDDGSMPKSLGSIDAGKRWNMMLTGQTMITGKGLSCFEKSAYDNTQLLKKKDAKAVKDSIPVDYIVLPVPTFNNGSQNAYGAVDGYIALTGTKNPDKTHMTNVANFMYYLDSDKCAAKVCQELYLTPICETGKTAYKALPAIENKNENNTACAELLTTQMAEARPDIPADLGSKALKIEDEVIVPKFQGLLAGEVTPEDMYKAIVNAAHDAFGADKCAD